MKKKDDDNFLDVNASMQGKLVFSDPVNLRINGRFEGELTTRGTLIIGKDAQVYANIFGENIAIAGTVKGKIQASIKVMFASTAVVESDVSTPTLSIEEGALFNGKCTMSEESTMSLEEVADYLSIEEDKIKEWVNKGKIPVEQEGERIVFNRREVDTWISQKV